MHIAGAMSQVLCCSHTPDRSKCSLPDRIHMGETMKIGFIGLGNVGCKLAGSILRNGFDLTVRDLDPGAAEPFLENGARWAGSPQEMAASCDVVITCLPSPAACAEVVEGPDGILQGVHPGMVWAEMSTTDETEVKRLAEKMLAAGGKPIECPVSGGCHRAATGNISIFAGCERETFEHMLPLLKVLGRRILHTGPIGSASVLKVATNYLATANLVSCAEALATMKKAGMDLNVAYEAIRISSGNSFVHETESQVILNGSRNIDFTMDLVLKDIGLFQSIADRAGIRLDLSPLLIDLFRNAQDRYGPREWSPNIVKRLEEDADIKVLATGFPAEMHDDEPEEPGYEVVPGNRACEKARSRHRHHFREKFVENNRINYIELNVTDIARARQFYGTVFGWTFTDYGPFYCEFSDGRMKGGFDANSPVHPGGPMIVLYHTDLDAVKQKVRDQGGTITKDIFPFPGGERFQFTDPEGYELAVWRIT